MTAPHPPAPPKPPVVKPLPAPRPVRRVRVPTVLQMEAVECGAACLAMVLAHHGRWMPLDEVRALCGVSRDGSNATNLLRAARALGLIASGRRLEPADLAKYPLPAIAFVNLNHFVVVEGMGQGCVHLNDPASGRRTVTAAEFDGQFSGVLLLFQTGPDFRPAGRPRRLSDLLADLADGTQGAVLAMLLAGLLATVGLLALPGLAGILIDHGQPDGWTGSLLLALAGAGLLTAAALALRRHLAARLHGRLAVLLSARLAWRLLRLPMPFFTQRYPGIIAARLGLARSIGRLAAGPAPLLVTAGDAVLLGLLVLLAIHWLPALIVAAIAGVHVLTVWLLRRRLADGEDQQALRALRLEGRTLQGLQMIDTLKATAGESRFLRDWLGLQALQVETALQRAHGQALLIALPAALSALATAGVLIAGGWLAAGQAISVGLLTALLLLTLGLHWPAEALDAAAREVQQARSAAAQLRDTLDHPLAPDFPDDDAPDSRAGNRADDTATATASETGGGGRSFTALGRVERLSGRIALRDVTFGYAPLGPPVVRGLSLDIEPGTSVALVGPSGSGKSTVGRLVSGLYRPWSGAILFDGVPLADIPRPVLRNSLAVVDQDIVLFDGTVRQNIALWDDGMALDRITEAAKDAMIHDDILARQGGYEARVAEDGRNFSGGQRQRLEIARALAGRPSLLVLDEATSALDPLAEAAIVDALRRRACTCLIIAHRLSTIRDCDEILVLEDGQVAERGTHDRLLARRGLYRALIET